jgi:hypothetical protein
MTVSPLMKTAQHPRPLHTSAPATGAAMGLELRIAKACGLEPVPDSPQGIAARIREQVPDLEVRHAMTRGGWHRLGGVVDGAYRRVAPHIREWAEAQAAGGLEPLLDRCAALGGFVTRLEGVTHYLTAPTGEGAADFLQIEVEQLQEVLERPLWDPDWLPDDVEELIDPLDFPRLAPEPVGPPRLVFRRLVSAADFLASQEAGPTLKRFLADWGRSSAGESARFCDHWCLYIRDLPDGSGDRHIAAKPVPLCADDAPQLPDDAVARGAALANLIHGFDRRVGYPFAWYFHMLTRRRVSFRLAEAVHQDLMGAFAYLPARDLAVLRDWHNAPYSV